MAIAKNRELYYEHLKDYVEHKIGKRIRSWKRDHASLTLYFLFEDGTIVYLAEWMALGDSMPEVQLHEVPKTFCTSCGEEWHASNFDWQGRCGTQLKKFWGNVRKVYWHRYLTNKNTT